ncbi:glutamate/aspartate:proton symporter [Salmonella enterica subsp. enterica]|uniref:Glutamate/aspartate:proton symporter n=1 Tax=Salmonella enterica I TaxID=59201 RepID=A0A379X2A7_SALET|nr:glutamate/aspartate:proton symporter [Salmonella enterica subsp. enterica]
MTVFRSISETMFKVTHMVMRYAPVGVFALIAVTVANFGFASLWPLAKLVLLVHFAIIFFALVVLGIVARLCGLSIWILIRILKDELILALLDRQLRERAAAHYREDGSLRRASLYHQFRGTDRLLI